MNQPTDREPNAEVTSDDAPRIYVASLSDYNAGVLHGVWLRADQSPETLHDQINHMLSRSPTARRYGDAAEEYAIHDFENFGAARIDEGESITRVAALARGLSAHGPAFASWWAIEQPAEAVDDTALERAFADHYIGEYASLVDYGLHLLDDLGFDIDELPGIPHGLRPYLTFDVAAWVRDMEYSGDLCTAPSDQGIYVFIC